jgi:hypothetical protein
MKTKILIGLIVGFWLLTFSVSQTIHAASMSSPQEEFSETWDEIGRALRDWAGRARDYFSFSVRVPRGERPVISLMLRNRDKLGLSADQVRNLEQLRNDFEKESIRNDADVRVAEMDLNSLLETQHIDMAKVEAKVREIERLRADIRIARIRTIEKGKQQLTADQRKKLQELFTESQFTSINPRPER